MAQIKGVSSLIPASLQATTDPAVFQVALSGVAVMVKRICTCPESRRVLDSQRLSPVLHALLCFSAGDPVLQAPMLELVARCLVHATSSCSQHRPSLRKWAGSAALHSHLPLAQEWHNVVASQCVGVKGPYKRATSLQRTLPMSPSNL